MRSVIRYLTKAVRLLLRGNVAELRYRLWNKWKGVDFGFASTAHFGLPRDHFHFSSGDMDAAAFCDYDGVTHIFMYNPFPCEVMSHVMTNLGASLERAPRPMTIVYRRPLCHEVIMTSGLFEAGPEQRPRGDVHPWRVYRRRRT